MLKILYWESLGYCSLIFKLDAPGAPDLKKI